MDIHEQTFKTKKIYKLDNEGSLISGVKLNVNKTYPDIPGLLQHFINCDDIDSWQEITNRIDYIYEGVSVTLNKLDEETNFMYHLKQNVRNGKLLVYKPNLAAPNCIDPATLHKTPYLPLNTQWPLIAAIMRWFHDTGKIHYSHMALAESSTSVDAFSALFSKALGYKVPNEAVFEGRCGDFYGGWGFYFVRKYLSAHSTLEIDDNPMEGYEESCQDIYLPPGNAKNKLMVYDLNKIQIDPSRGRAIHVPGGKNFSEIILHKVIVGGDISDPKDLSLYPGSVLINIPVTKMHAQDLITNAIKNLGIGLYPSQCAGSNNPSDKNWLYASPSNDSPSFKSKLPHSPWVLKINEKTHLPLKDENGNYIAHKTDGFSGTQCDLIKAVQSLGTLMVHISDNINIINMNHCVGELAQPADEGFIWASLDCVALDSFCARYCFKKIPLIKAKQLQEENHWSTNFLQRIPIPKVKDQQIISETGVDSPLLRYTLYEDAEKRGIGYCDYHVKGLNLITNAPMASYLGHLLEQNNQKWKELITKTLYYNPETLLYDLQATVLGYAKAHDTLYNTDLYQTLMDALDENHDGIIDYNEKGMGFETAMIEPLAYAFNVQVKEKHGPFKAAFIQSTVMLKYSNPKWNAEGHDFLKIKLLLLQLSYAFALSQNTNLKTDLFYPNVKYGNGYWPSFKTTKFLYSMNMIYGGFTSKDITLDSTYGCVFQYCDQISNCGLYSKSNNPLENYFEDLENGKEPLNFTLYLPVGYGELDGVKIPNTVETLNSNLIFTAHFEEIW